MQSKHPEKIVIVGAGLMGASAAFQLSRRLREEGAPVEVTVLERSRENSPTGSSAGEARISRKTSFENAGVIPAMTVRANAVLHELGAVEPSRTVILGNNPATSTRRARRRRVPACGTRRCPICANRFPT